MDDRVRDLQAFVETAAPTHLVGHSYGAFVCLLIAMRDVRRMRCFDEGNRAGAVPGGGAEARHSLSQGSSIPASRTGREQDAAKGGIAVGALKCATRSGSEIMLPHATVDGFRSRVLGGVLSRGDDGYDRARVYSTR